MKATSLHGSTRKKRPAPRLINTKELPREDWLQIRKLGIGSSDAATAVGLNSNKSQLELFLGKTSLDAGMPTALSEAAPAGSIASVATAQCVLSQPAVLNAAPDSPSPKCEPNAHPF